MIYPKLKIALQLQSTTCNDSQRESLAGWPRLESYMSKTPQSAAFSRFAELNVENLLSSQDPSQTFSDKGNFGMGGVGTKTKRTAKKTNQEPVFSVVFPYDVLSIFKVHGMTGI